MGTNFYLNYKVCKCCNRPEENIHIGKRSAGNNWLFSDYFKSYDEWVGFLKKNKDSIYDEYDRKVSFDEMLETFETKGKSHNDERFHFKDKKGYDFGKGGFS